MSKLMKNMEKTINDFENKRAFRGKFIFEERSKKNDILCYVLAGYKEYLWDVVFSRIKKASKDVNIDICIVSSGKYCKELSEVCKENDWSYLSTTKNNLCMIQNIVLKLFESANWIFKLDEDIFLTDKYFQRMIEAFRLAEESNYNIGILAPLIPITSYVTTKLLEILELQKIYKDRFGDLSYGWSTEKPFYKNAEVAKFFWGEGGIIPNLDELDRRLNDMPSKVEPCSILFNIGAVLFTREFWDKVGPFKLGIMNKTGMGRDEKILNRMANFMSRPIMVSQNIVVGHFSFTPQNEEMKDYFNKNRDMFGKISPQ